MITYRKTDTIRRRGRLAGVMPIAVAARALTAAGRCSSLGLRRTAPTPARASSPAAPFPIQWLPAHQALFQ